MTASSRRIPPGHSGIGPKWWVLAVTAAGSFMSALDASVVNVSLPVIAQTTQSAVSTVEWVALIYLITSSSSLLLFGRLADLYGNRAIYVTGQSVFLLGSLCCGLSGSIGALIATRALQALGAAMILALAPGILISAFPARERGRALGLQATVTFLGLTIGPGLGGLLTHRFGWPSIFFINIPIGIVMLRIAWKHLPPDRPPSGQPFDPAGAATMAIALAAALLALTQSERLGWDHPAILVAYLLALAAGAAFIRIERRHPHPALDLRLFRHRRFSASILAAYLAFLASSAVSFLMPFFLLGATGRTPAQAGLVMMAVPLAMVSVTSASGILSDRIGVRLPATAGMLLSAAGLWMLGGLQAAAPASHIIAPLLLSGLGMGLFTAPNNSAIMGSAPRERQGVAGALLGASRTVGFASGIALAGLVYTTTLRSPHAAATPDDIARAVRTGFRVIAAFPLAAATCSLLRGADERMPLQPPTPSRRG